MNSININLRCSTPPETVFNAWINEELIHKWWSVVPSGEIVTVNIDLKVKGKFFIRELDKTGNRFIDYDGEYVEINKPTRLIFMLSIAKQSAGATQVTIEITKHDLGCELQLSQTPSAPGLTEENWKEMLGQLKLTLENQ